jgi:hypothetical protein
MPYAKGLEGIAGQVGLPLVAVLLREGAMLNGRCGPQYLVEDFRTLGLLGFEFASPEVFWCQKRRRRRRRRSGEPKLNQKYCHRSPVAKGGRQDKEEGLVGWSLPSAEQERWGREDGRMGQVQKTRRDVRLG